MKHPLSINFKTLQQYDFSITKPDEIIFFEWLIVKRLSFGNKTFYFQQNRCINDLGIKRHRLEKIKALFKKYGLLIELKGFANTTHYTVNDDFIERFIQVHVKPEFQTELTKKMLKLDFKRTKKISSRNKKKVQELINQLNETYNRRRTIYSEKKGDREYTYTELAYNNKTLWQLNILLSKYKLDVIDNSFIAYSDKLIRGLETSYHILNNFSSYDKEADKFAVFEKYLNHFNLDYKCNLI